MRGRTNITQRKQPVINGQLEQFVVENNNVITKGDFVSVVHGSEVTLVSSNPTPTEKYIVDKQSGKYIVYDKLHSMLYLIQCVGDEVTILDSLNIGGYTSSIPHMVCYDANLNQLTLYNGEWCEYTITNDEFVFVKNFTSFSFMAGNNESVSAESVLAIIPFPDSYFLVFSASISGNSTYKYVYCGICDKQLTTNIYKTQAISYQSFQGRDNSVVKTENGNVFVFLHLYYSQHYYYLHHFKIDGANTVRSQVYYQYSSSSIDNKICTFNGSNTICFANGLYSYYFYVDEGTTWKQLQFSISKSVASSYSPFCSVSFIDDDKLLNVWGNTRDGNHFVVYEYDENLESFVEVQNNTDVSNETILGLFVKTTTGLYLMFKDAGSNSWGFRVLYYNNGVYQFGLPTNKVRSYDGASALGFAASGGNAGDTILVYVPLSN